MIFLSNHTTLNIPIISRDSIVIIIIFPTNKKRRKFSTPSPT